MGLPLLSGFSALFSAGKEVGGQYLQNKAAESAAKSEERIANINARAKMAEKTQEIKAERVRGMADSWKDEAWTILFIAIIAACFIPWTQPYVDKGFTALAKTPEWFQWAVWASITASFGVKSGKGLAKGWHASANAITNIATKTTKKGRQDDTI